MYTIFSEVFAEDNAFPFSQSIPFDARLFCTIYVVHLNTHLLQVVSSPCTKFLLFKESSKMPNFRSSVQTLITPFIIELKFHFWLNYQCLELYLKVTDEKIKHYVKIPIKDCLLLLSQSLCTAAFLCSCEIEPF